MNVSQRNSKICGSRIPNVIPQPMIIHQRQILLLMEGCGLANENKPIEWKKEIIIKGIIKGKDWSLGYRRVRLAQWKGKD